jgi:hypothetical protein
MPSVETLTAQMAEAGQLDEDITTVVRTADDAWVFRFEDIDVELEYSEVSGNLLVAVVIGAPPREGREAVLEALLSYSFLWRDTGGVRMAMTGKGGDVVQLFEVSADNLTPKQLVVIVSNLAANARIWRAFLASGAATEAPSPSPAQSTDFVIHV